MQVLLRWLLLASVMVVSVPRLLLAQAHPGLTWETLRSGNIRVHYTRETEDLAYRTMANAVWAYERLAEELPPPRGVVDIVVADNADFANGVATPYPTNRIVIFARPPVDELSLRNHADWNQLVVTHEMVHIFQLDRVGGWWRIAQRIFGRAAPFFPHSYAPNWLLEGVAVHYESRLTGGGRLAGVEFPAAIRALAREQAIPTLDAVVTPRPYHPGGNAPYLLGSVLVDQAVRRDPSVPPEFAMAQLFRRMSNRINPWRLDQSAREALGTTFTALYAAWRDSLHRADALSVGARGDAAPDADDGVVTIAAANWTAAYPRFAPDGDLRYVADNERQTPAHCAVSPRGDCARLGRRNSIDAIVSQADGWAIGAEWDWTDPYTLRSDLTRQRGWRRQMLTRGERLAHPDVHEPSGRIVAVQTRPGSTELVTRSPDDPFGRILAAGSERRTWTEPRWSRDGTRVAAALWELGGRTSIVVLDTAGRELQRFSPRATDRLGRLALVSSPAWLPGDSLLLFASDHDGVPMIYRGDLRTGAYAPLWRTQTALRQPDVSADGSQLAAVELRADGWAVVTRAMPPLSPLESAAPARDAESLPAWLPPTPPAEIVQQRFTPSETAHPTWWLPAVESADDGGVAVGVLTGGRDVVGRHAWNLTAMRDAQRPEWTTRVGYDYAGFGNPVISAGWEQSWVHGLIQDTGGTPVGTLSRRDGTATLAVYLSRPRVRATTYALIVGELGVLAYRTSPENLLAQLNAPELMDLDLMPRVALALGFSTLQRPGLSVSTEDGVAAQVFARRRFVEASGGAASNEAILEFSAAKSLPLPGFARHVVAIRAARGTTGSRSQNLFEVGGVSGGSLPILPGLAIGGSRRTFAVRGFAPATQFGPQAAAVSAEYRAPLFRIGRGAGLLPVNLQKLSLLTFADAGSSWCEVRIETSPFCNSARPPRRWIASVGGELLFDTALQYDVLYRMRLGVALPVRGESAAPRAATVYLTFGSTF